jgi:NAD(P)H-flavin reductase
VRVPSGKDAVFAIASAPGAAHFEYLIRANDGVAGQWVKQAPGQTVEVGLPEGAGYPLERARGRTLLLVGTGTGWAPLRSVLQTIRARRADFGPVHALYGAHEPSQLAWAEEFPQLAGEGITVRPTVSRAAPGWTGDTGRVQHLVTHLPTEDAVAFLCGQSEMVEEVTRALGVRGVSADRVFLNY